MDNKEQNWSGAMGGDAGNGVADAGAGNAAGAAAGTGDTAGAAGAEATNGEQQNSVLQNDWQVQLAAERAREGILKRSATGRYAQNMEAVSPRPVVQPTPPTAEQLAATQGSLQSELDAAKKQKHLLIAVIGILGGVILLAIIIVIVVLVAGSTKEEEVVEAEPTTVSCLGLEIEKKEGYTYDCKTNWSLTIKNTAETFGMTMRVAEGTLEDVEDDIGTMKGVWEQLGYTGADLETKTYDGERMLTMVMAKGDVRELMVFKAEGTDHVLMMEVTDYSGAADEDAVLVALAMIKGMNTDGLAENNEESLTSLAGQLTLLEEIAVRAANDTVRRGDVDRLKTAIETYRSENGGKLPTDGAKLIKSYLSDEFTDPDGVDYTVQIDMYADDLDEKGPLNDYNKSYTMHMITRAKCSGEKTAETDNSRNFAVLYRLESGTVYCVDNQ